MGETVWVKDTPMYPNGVVMKDGNLYVPAKIGTVRELDFGNTPFVTYEHTCCGFKRTLSRDALHVWDFAPMYCMKCGARMVSE